MTDAERDHLFQRIAGLERANRAWKLLAAVLSGLVVVLLLLATAFAFSLQQQLLRERERFTRARMEVEAALRESEAEGRELEAQRLLVEQQLKEAADRLNTLPGERQP